MNKIDESSFSELKQQMLIKAKKDNIFNDVSPVMEGNKSLQTASYLLMLKRNNTNKSETKTGVENLLNLFVIIANYYIDSDCEDLNNDLLKIKEETQKLCDKILNKTLIDNSQLNSKLDVETWRAINLDLIFDEIEKTYNYLLKQKVLILNEIIKQNCEKLYKSCCNKNKQLNEILEINLSMPTKTLNKIQTKQSVSKTI